MPLGFEHCLDDKQLLIQNLIVMFIQGELLREMCVGMELLIDTLSLGQHVPSSNIGDISIQDKWLTWVGVHEDGHSGEHLVRAFKSMLVFQHPSEFGAFAK